MCRGVAWSAGKRKNHTGSSLGRRPSLVCHRGRQPAETRGPAQTALGRKIKPFIDSGSLVPSALVAKVMSAEVEKVQNDLVLFDGFPRRSAQIKLIFQMLKIRNFKLGAVLVLTLDLPVAIKRLSGRRTCVKCGKPYNVDTKPPQRAGRCNQCGGNLIQRDNDRAEVIARRFKSHESETLPVIEFFRAGYAQVIWEQSATAPFSEIMASAGRRLEELARP